MSRLDRAALSDVLPRLYSNRLLEADDLPPFQTLPDTLLCANGAQKMTAGSLLSRPLMCPGCVRP
jgi:hypothetical protein